MATLRARRCLEAPGQCLVEWSSYNDRHLIRRITDARFHLHGVQMTSQPQRLTSQSLWNCSVPFWSDFRPHLVCNRHKECESGKDERECPWTLCEEDGMQFSSYQYEQTVKQAVLLIVFYYYLGFSVAQVKKKYTRVK